ncbi:MAG: hypothetical protein V4507_15055, partial [Verrucomicrobiota bacterium]
MYFSKHSLFFKTFLILSLFAFQKNQAADYIKNGDFKQGRVGWSEEGRVVFLNPAGEELSQEEDGTIPALKVTLA